MNKTYVITFHTHFDALVCMRSLKKQEKTKNAPVKMIPVPRTVSSSCGTAVQLELKTFSAEDLHGFDYDSLFELAENGSYEKTASKEDNEQ